MDFAYHRILTADRVQQDDWFKMGGQIYRVTNIVVGTTHATINAILLDGSPEETAKLTLLRNSAMKIYNQ